MTRWGEINCPNCDDIDAAFTNLHREYDRRGDRIAELERKLAMAVEALEKAGCTYAANDARLIHSETQVRDICRATLAAITETPHD